MSKIKSFRYEWTGRFNAAGLPCLKNLETGVEETPVCVDWETVVDPITGKSMYPLLFSTSVANGKVLPRPFTTEEIKHAITEKVSQISKTEDVQILNRNLTPEETKNVVTEGIRQKYAPGKEYDQGKTRWDLVPWEAVEPLADILTFGSKKYGDNSWQRVDNAVERYKAALFRHLIAWCKGERKDPESGRSHLHHVLTNCVFLIWFELHGYCAPEAPKVNTLKEVNRKEIGVSVCNEFCGPCLNCIKTKRSNRYHYCSRAKTLLYQDSEGTLYCPDRDLSNDTH